MLQWLKKLLKCVLPPPVNAFNREVDRILDAISKGDLELSAQLKQVEHETMTQLQSQFQSQTQQIQLQAQQLQTQIQAEAQQLKSQAQAQAQQAQAQAQCLQTQVQAQAQQLQIQLQTQAQQLRQLRLQVHEQQEKIQRLEEKNGQLKEILKVKTGKLDADLDNILHILYAGSFTSDMLVKDNPERGAGCDLLGIADPDISVVQRVNIFNSLERSQEVQLRDGVLKVDVHVMENQDKVQFGRFTASEYQDEMVVGALPYEDITVYAYVLDGGWKRLDAPGRYDCSLFLAKLDDGGSIMAYPPQSWKPLINSCRQFLAFGGVELTGSELRIFAPEVFKGGAVDYTLVQSYEPLIDWSNADQALSWSAFSNDKDSRWCYDGYYRPCPSYYMPGEKDFRYIPSGKDVFFPMTAAYMCRDYLHMAASCRLAEDLAISMLKVMSKRQCEQGFFPTPPASGWLSNDYNIGPGFYDTRWNSDLIDTYCKAYNDYGLFQNILERYAEFFFEHARLHHWETLNGGWLVDDYSHPDSSQGHPTHMSLNHQLAEIQTLYHLESILKDTRLAPLAERMISGIVDIGERWIMPNQNLQYGIYRDGSYCGKDYPYLTYDDLYDVQKILEARGDGRNTMLDRLMEAKKSWMDANGITGYKK